MAMSWLRNTISATVYRYLKSGAWRCPSPDNPTGAHHWLVDSDGKATCKYCSATKNFTELQIALGMTPTLKGRHEKRGTSRPSKRMHRSNYPPVESPSWDDIVRIVGNGA